MSVPAENSESSGRRSAEVFRVGLDWKGNGAVRMGVAEAIARVFWQTGEAAALAVGINIRTARRNGFRRDCDGIGDAAGANGCGVHEVFLVLVRGGTRVCVEKSIILSLMLLRSKSFAR